MVVLASLLAACGGGGGSGGGSTGGGSAAPAGSQGGLPLPNSGNGTTVIAENGTLGDLRIVRQSGSGTSSVSVGGAPRTWQNGSASIGDLAVFNSSDGTSAVVTGGNGSGGASSIESLQYTSFGVWLEASATGVLSGSSERISGAGGFVIGDATPVGDMPEGGSASYRGRTVGVELDGDSPARPLSGDFTANVDFARGVISATADLAGAVDGAPFGTIAMDSLGIAGNSFSGTARTIDGRLNGSVEGGFAGPSASELGGSFELGGSATVHGAFAGSTR